MEVPWEGEIWRCRKHPSRPRSGVCPACLRDRLLLLCPNCSNVRPCACSPSSSSSTSSFSSLASFDLARSSGADSGIGTIGRVSHLIDSEPAFRRSRSVAFPFLRTGPGDGGAAGPRLQREQGWASLWPFSRATAVRADGKDEDGRATAVRADGKDEAGRPSAATKLSRSRSVCVESYPDPIGGEVRLKAWNWHFPSPMKAFRHRKSSKVVQERSPLCRG